MSTICKKKCSYKPLQKNGLITPTSETENTWASRESEPIDVDEKDKTKKPDVTKIIIGGKTFSVDQTSGEFQTVTKAGNVVGYVKNNNPKTFKPV